VPGTGGCTGPVATGPSSMTAPPGSRVYPQLSSDGADH
jgi:hypothetical protein